MGRVLVGCRRRGDRVVISVIDTGLGIPASQRKLIFKEFKRLDEGTKVARGLGLGLSIVDRISRLLKHPIKVQSEPGKGSHFTLDVPLSLRGAKKMAAASTTAGRSLMPSNVFVLVIDNDEMILKGMKILLEGWGCIVVTARNGLEAHEAFAQEGAHDPLVIADYHLDTETGLDIIAALRERIDKLFPAILLTADRSKAVRERTQAEDIYLLHKPVKPAALRALVTQCALAIQARH